MSRLVTDLLIKYIIINSRDIYVLGRKSVIMYECFKHVFSFYVLDLIIFRITLIFYIMITLFKKY